MKKSRLTLISFAALTLIFLVPAPRLALAGDPLIVPIPAVNGGAGITDIDVSLGTYIEAIYYWGLGIAALLGVLMLVFGGAEYVLSAGSFVESSAGKERIKSAVFGLIILLGASLILRIVDADLTDLSKIEGTLLNTAKIATYDPRFADAILSPNGSTNFESPAYLASVADRLNQAEEANGTEADYDTLYRKLRADFESYFSQPERRQEEIDKFKSIFNREPTAQQIENGIFQRKVKAFEKLQEGLDDEDHLEDAFSEYD